MRGIIKYSLIVLLGLMLAIALAWWGLFYTAPGKQFITGQAEHQLTAQFGGEAQLSLANSRLPGLIEITDLTLSHNNTPWLTADQAQLRWSPFALLRGNIVIADLQLRNVALLAAPPQRQKTKSDTSWALPSLPISLPSITIQNFTLDSISIAEELAGRAVQFSCNGYALANRNTNDVQFSLITGDQQDRLEAKLHIDPDSKEADLSVRLQSSATGFAAHLAGTDEPISITVAGRGTTKDLPLTLQAELGTIGRLSAELKVSTTPELNGNAIGTLELFQQHASDKISPFSTLAFDASITGRDDMLDLSIASLRVDGHTLQGQAQITHHGGEIKTISGSSEFSLDPSMDNGITQFAGHQFVSRFHLTPSQDSIDVTAMLEGDHLSAEITNGQAEPSANFTGDVKITRPPTGAPNDILPLQAQLYAKATYSVNGQLSADDIALYLDDDAVLTGHVNYALADQTVSSLIAFDVPQQHLSVIAASIEPDSGLDGQVSLSGPLNNLTAEIESTFPGTKINGGDFPAMDITAAIAGLPASPSGEINAIGRDKRRLDALLRTSKAGALRVPSFEYKHAHFSLTGKGELNPQRNGGTLSLDFTSQQPAELFPGFILDGALSANALWDETQKGNFISVKSKSLSAQTFTLTDLDLSTQGPIDTHEITATIGEILNDGQPFLSAVQFNGLLKDRRLVQANQLAFGYKDFTARNTDPFTVTLKPDLEIKNGNLIVNDTSTLQLDAVITQSKMAGKAVIEQFSLPGSTALLNLTAKVDTSRQPLGEGDFSIQSDLESGTQAPFLSGTLLWDGEKIQLRDDQKNDAIQLYLTAPLSYSANARSVDLSKGNLDGHLAYQGPLEPLIALAPASFGSIEGGIEAAIKLSGPVDNPALNGNVQLKNGAFTDLVSGFSLININNDLTLDYTKGVGKLAVTGAASASQRERQSIQWGGEMSLNDQPTLDAKITVDQAKLKSALIKNIDTSGTVTLTGPLAALKAQGDITIDQMDMELAVPVSSKLVDIEVVDLEHINGHGKKKPPSQSKSFPIDLDINLAANDQVFLRGRGLESEWAANLQIRTIEQAPVTTGQINLRRGSLDFSGRRFDITKGILTFDRLAPNNPSLDIRAEYETSSDITAAITIKGRALQPVVELSSTPNLPREDVMAILLFGKPANELSATQSLQMAQALAQLSGIGGMGSDGGLKGGLRQSLGLDLLNMDFDPENSVGSSLTVGKYVADGLFVSATQDVQGKNGSVNVEYEVTDNITVETELQQDGDQTVSTNWKHDF